ncbi:MAG: hypothetical protein IPJ93_14645 [Bacteroidota bacterium]|nr:MAG: hypothetical protein IPJ93_14645 [Bacteroidota bacterium]
MRSHQENLDRKAEARIKKFALDLKQAKNKKAVIEKFLSEAGLKTRIRRRSFTEPLIHVLLVALL